MLILSDELNLEVLSYGSTTLKVKATGKGAEGDDCFYIQHATDLANKEDIDITRDPPPDLVGGALARACRPFDLKRLTAGPDTLSIQVPLPTYCFS